MARHQINFRQLKALRDDILRLQQQSPAFYFFFLSRVEKFKSLNSIALNTLESRQDEFIKKYVKQDKDMQPITEERDGQQVYCFYSEEYRQKYLDAQKNFFSQKISIEI